MENDLGMKAIAYWQDRLAKFFPTSKGPTACEVEMYVAGFRLGREESSLEQADVNLLSNVFRAELTSLRAQLEGAEKALELCAARAGVPDPSEACRLVLLTAQEALSAMRDSKGNLE